MIVDRIENRELYEKAGGTDRIARALSFLSGVSAEEFSEKTVERDGRAIYAMFQTYLTESPAGRGYETHRDYIDVQYVLEGEETMRVRNVHGLKPTTEYDEEKDFTLYELAEGTDVKLTAGDFVVLFPHDAHVPKLATDEPTAVKKVVVKVRL